MYNAHICAHTEAYTHTYTDIHTLSLPLSLSYTHMHTHTHSLSLKHTHTHTHINTHTDTPMQACASPPSPSPSPTPPQPYLPTIPATHTHTRTRARARTYVLLISSKFYTQILQLIPKIIKRNNSWLHWMTVADFSRSAGSSCPGRDSKTGDQLLQDAGTAPKHSPHWSSCPCAVKQHFEFRYDGLSPHNL